jgi:hypothetical protein
MPGPPGLAGELLKTARTAVLQSNFDRHVDANNVVAYWRNDSAELAVNARMKRLARPLGWVVTTAFMTVNERDYAARILVSRSWTKDFCHNLPEPREILAGFERLYRPGEGRCDVELVTPAYTPSISMDIVELDKQKLELHRTRE